MKNGGHRDYEAVAELFGALSSPVRAAIVHRLTERPWAVGELAAELEISQPLVSQHLKVLRVADLVSRQQEGRSILYSLRDEHVAHVFLDALHHTEENSHDHHR